jgi:hypothetical protein
MHWNRETDFEESGMTLSRPIARHSIREVVECGSPMPLWRIYCDTALHPFIGHANGFTSLP